MSAELVHWPYENPPAHEAFWFEKIEVQEYRVWAHYHRSTIIMTCIGYFLSICVGQWFMKYRAAYTLRRPLVLWNFSLAIFSIMGAARLSPELFGILAKPNGFYRSVCVREGLNPPAAFWALMFTLSKIVELGDTAFLVLRKKPVVFLHWFHHLSMVYCTFLLFAEGEPIARWPGFLNYTVHSIMYSYFTLRALEVKLPKILSMMITSIQIVQFMIGISINLYSLWVLWNGVECARTSDSIKIQLMVGSMYLFLFIKFFIDSYIAKPKKE